MRYKNILSMTAIAILLCAGICHAEPLKPFRPPAELPNPFLPPEPFRPPQTEPVCCFENLKLPDQFVVYAAGAKEGRTLPYQIDESNYPVTQIDVAVNDPQQPVVLLLGAYEPTIWRIGWSPETEIVAVLVSGYHEQRVAGLTKQTPLMNSTHSNKGKCRYFYLPDGMGNMNAVSRSLFGREVDLAFLAEKGRVVVGKPLAADTKLITSSRISPESFYDRDAPMGQAGLDNAVKKGILRPATLEDVQAWQNAMAKKDGGKTALPPVAGQDPLVITQKNMGPMMLENAYVVLKPFKIPAGLASRRTTATFYVLKGVPMPTGNLAPFNIYDFNTITHYRPGTRHAPRRQ